MSETFTLGEWLARLFQELDAETNPDGAAQLMALMRPLAEQLAAGQVPARGCCEYWAVVEKRPDGLPSCEKILGGPTLHCTREGAERALAEDILPLTSLRGCFEVRPVYLSWQAPEAVPDATAPLRRRLALVERYRWRAPDGRSVLVEKWGVEWSCQLIGYGPHGDTYVWLTTATGRYWPDLDALFAELERKGLLPEEKHEA